MYRTLVPTTTYFNNLLPVFKNVSISRQKRLQRKGYCGFHTGAGIQKTFGERKNNPICRKDVISTGFIFGLIVLPPLSQCTTMI